MYGHTHTNKTKKSMKEDLDPSSATLYVITTSVKCKEKNNFETMKFLIHKYTVIFYFSTYKMIHCY